MADDVTLKPCPFCGAPAELGVREWPGEARDYWVWCSRYSATDPHGCFATTREHQGPDNAIAAWNTRVPDPRIAELEAELAAIKARRCETCRHCKQWTTSDGEPRAACTRLSDAHRVIEFVVPERDGCSRWQDKEAADGNV